MKTPIFGEAPTFNSMNDDASRVAREGKRQCASEPRNEFRPANLT